MLGAVLYAIRLQPPWLVLMFQLLQDQGPGWTSFLVFISLLLSLFWTSC